MAVAISDIKDVLETNVVHLCDISTAHWGLICFINAIWCK